MKCYKLMHYRYSRWEELQTGPNLEVVCLNVSLLMPHSTVKDMGVMRD